MARTTSHALALGIASMIALASLRSAAAQSSPPGPAQPGQPSVPQATPAQPRPAAPAQPNRALNTGRAVQAPAARPQSAPPAQRPQQPIPQQAAQQTPDQVPVQPADAPQAGGYNNSGGLIDSTALQTEASQGVHYHYHYYGAGAVVSNPGYGQAGYVNPATAPVPNNPYLTPIYGPGNPAPMNTLMGANNDNYNGRVGGGALGGAAAAQVGGQAWSYGGGIGHWNPYAYGGNGYVEGFND